MSDVNGVGALLPNIPQVNVHPIDDAQLDVQPTKNLTCQWLNARRGVDCLRANGICAEYTFRQLYFNGNLMAEYTNAYSRHLVRIYNADLRNIQV